LFSLVIFSSAGFFLSFYHEIFVKQIPVSPAVIQREGESRQNSKRAPVSIDSPDKNCNA
jgi:hypothetical protein